MENREEQIKRLAYALYDPDGEKPDPLDVHESIAPFLRTDELILLSEHMEVCPVHSCDIRICADDEFHGDEVYTTEGYHEILAKHLREAGS